MILADIWGELCWTWFLLFMMFGFAVSRLSKMASGSPEIRTAAGSVFARLLGRLFK